MKKPTAKNPKKTKKKAAPDNPKKEKEFKLYVLWKSLPPLLRNELEKKPDLWKQTGFGENPIIEELLKIKTQGEFAIKFEVSPDTVSDWNKTIMHRDLLGDYRQWAKMLTSNLLMAMYHKGIKYGDPHRIELWLKSIHGWTEKQQVEVEAGQSLADIIKNSLAAKRDAKRKQ